MEFLNLAFSLGVVFAIFGFLWGILSMILTLIRGARVKSVFEEYALKMVQYFFLVDVTFLFCIEKEDENVLLLNKLILAALILIIYFTGKLQNRQSKSNFFQVSGSALPQLKPVFNLKAEIAVITVSILIFTAFIFYPAYAQNAVSNWFYESISEIEKTPVFGFIFKVIGFFVLMSIIFKLLNGFSYMFSGAPLISVNRQFQQDGDSDRKNEDDEKFDDFEEMK